VRSAPRNSNSNKVAGRSWAELGSGARRERDSLGLHPNMPYHPVPGLVALFARVASYTRNPRAPHSRPLAATEFSYAAVVRAVAKDGGRFNGGNMGANQRFGGAPLGQSSGQGSSLSRGGFQPGNQGFHPGYAGHGSYTGFGGGCYGGRGRPGGRPPAHDPGFAAQRSRGNVGIEAQVGRGSGGVEAQGLANNGRVDMASQLASRSNGPIRWVRLVQRGS
jgi:hypothetical protein